MTARQARKARRAVEREARKLEQRQQQIPETKIAANCTNAQKSTGPKTAEGKTNSSRNAFKHGLYSKQLVTSAEEAAALDTLKADLRAEHQPVNETEEILVNELAEQFWRLRRARVLEASLLDSETTVLTHLAAIQRMMSCAERGFHKALTALRQLQKDRGFVPANSQPVGQTALPSADGFVSQKSVEIIGFVSQNLPDEPHRTPESALERSA